MKLYEELYYCKLCGALGVYPGGCLKVNRDNEYINVNQKKINFKPASYASKNPKISFKKNYFLIEHQS